MKIILDRWQGLGDNLQISTIPRRMFEKYGEKCVWISDATFYRNPEIRGLVWESNPYVAGFTDEPGESKRGLINFGNYNWIEMWERIYGLEEPYSSKPEIYVSGFKDTFNVSSSVVIDISYSEESLTVNQKHFPQFLEKHRAFIKDLYKSLENKSVYKVINPNLSKQASVDLIAALCPEIETKVLQVTNIKEYCEVISNCSNFVSTHSGNHSLAAALRQFSVCLIPANYYHGKYFTYPNVKYVLL